jgi:hypothetical protein
MATNTLIGINTLRTDRLHALLGVLQFEKGWTETHDVHFMCESAAGQPWAVRMYLGKTPPKRGSFDYVASIVPDPFSIPGDYYAETKLGAQAVRDAGSDDPLRFGSHEELVNYLRACINA